MMNTPYFEWKGPRSAGVLLHPTSLPTDYAVGNFGKNARSFVDLIASCGFRYWQMLPLGPVGSIASPYQSYSSHAINSLMIDWDELIDWGWVDASELNPICCKNTQTVPFIEMRESFDELLNKTLEKGLVSDQFKEEFDLFKKKHQHWLEDYALFRLLLDQNDYRPIIEWNPKHRVYQDAVRIKLRALDKLTVERVRFEQFILFKQWFKLKDYANKKGIFIIGDIPIYVSPLSDDLWANRDEFQVTKEGRCTRLAGVPPDYFNEDGQLWGNPLYNWEQHEETNFKWWIERISHTLSLFDTVRFDHFRGLESYWSVPANASTAKDGEWVEGPGIRFFKCLKEALPHADMILEDLGDVTDAVLNLKDATGFPGLAVLQFAFSDDAQNLYLPHNVSKNTVIYTGTHDNDTTQGWYQSATEQEKDYLRRYLRVDGQDVAWDLIRAAYRSHACLCIVPVQDLLSLGSDSRMNVPGKEEGNWSWRLTHDQLFNIGTNKSGYLRELSKMYGR